MPTTSRKARHFPINRSQLDILRRAASGQRFQASGRADEAACLEMWRTGLLRMNGEADYQISRLGMAALDAQVPAAF
jgi:hypothetical protein